MLHKIHFTPEHASELLKKIKPKIEKMAALKTLLDKKNFDVYTHEYFGGAGPNGTGEFPGEMEELVDIIKELDEMGILIKGINNGIIDFPAVRSNGEEVKHGNPPLTIRVRDGRQPRLTFDLALS